MSWLLDLWLMRFFELYLVLAFLASTAFRVRQYRVVLGILRKVPGRWPRLFQLLREHSLLFLREVFLTWATVRPLALSLALLLAHTFANRLVWPQASLTGADLLDLWLALPLVLITGVAMIAFDAYTITCVAEIDHVQIEKYLDQAEYWLQPWRAPVVRIFTLGFINPRKIVTQEVHTALGNMSRLLNRTLWWVSMQTGLRLAFGLSLWGTYLLAPWVKSLQESGPGNHEAAWVWALGPLSGLPAGLL